MTQQPSGSIICIGLCCLDLVGKVDQFPSEDTDQRAFINWHLGGNAAHNAIVLAALESTPVYFAGSIPSETSINGEFVKRTFSKHSVDTSLCQPVSGDACPVSMVIVNTDNASRTILHDRGEFPEFSLSSFRDLDLARLSITWVHFEGRRNVPEMVAMMSDVRSLNQRLTSASDSRRIRTSVELEKCRPELSDLLAYADVVFLSKEFAQFHGAEDKVTAVRRFIDRVKPGAAVICAWGELGCSGAVNDGNHGNSSDNGVVSVPAAIPDGPISDTLGAGDAFVAACLHGLRLGRTLAEAMRLGARLAAAKCARSDGFERVAEWATSAVGPAEGSDKL